VHLPQAVVLDRQAGVSPLQVSSTSHALPSSVHCSTASSLQRFSEGVHATHFPSKQAEFGLAHVP
jgi:hypothetical protein